MSELPTDQDRIDARDWVKDAEAEIVLLQAELRPIDAACAEAEATATANYTAALAAARRTRDEQGGPIVAKIEALRAKMQDIATMKD